MPVGTGTGFGIASGTKGLTALTALTVLALVARGTLDLATTARSVLGADLPLVEDTVTVEHLLAHRSGIGDYLDESAVASVADHVMPVPVHRLAATEDYLQVLDGHPQVSAPGEQFAYNNSGFALLALLAERAAGAPFHDLVDELVCRPAGLTGTGFPRSDELPPGAATGYLDAAGGGGRTCCTCPCGAAATAARTPPWPTCTGSGRPGRPAGTARCHDRPAQRQRPGQEALRSRHVAGPR